MEDWNISQNYAFVRYINSLSWVPGGDQDPEGPPQWQHQDQGFWRGAGRGHLEVRHPHQANISSHPHQTIHYTPAGTFPGASSVQLHQQEEEEWDCVQSIHVIVVNWNRLLKVTTCRDLLMVWPMTKPDLMDTVGMLHMLCQQLQVCEIIVQCLWW